MAAKPLTDAQHRATLAAVRNHGSVSAAARALKLTIPTMSSRWSRAKDWAASKGIPVPALAVETGVEAQLPPDGFAVKGNTAEVSRMTPERVRSLADLVRVCDIDTTEWEIERYVCNKWEIGAKIGPQDTAKIEVTPLFQVKAWLKRKVAVVEARAEIAALRAEAARLVRPSFAIVKRIGASSGNMFEPALPDLHVGKLAWAKETGWENYDGKIAERVFEDALAALIRRTSSYKFERVVFVIGNDLLHADTKAGTTTGGTPLDMDSRYHKSFALVRKMKIRAIDCLRTIAPVDVIPVPGNHDTLSVWHLGDSLECWYRQCKDVRVFNDPAMRKYYQWSKVMLMFTHGNRGKLTDYPLVMASEQKQMWGETIHREAHTGDKHGTKVQELHGVRVRISPALCPPDAWHAEHQFVGNARSAEAFVWHREEGLIGTANYTVPAPAKGEAA